MDLVSSIYHLATSKTVFVDNYYGFLAAVQFKKDVECIQLWHAAGAIKKFALHDPSNETRNEAAIDRFKRVYANFHKIVVGSENLAHIYFQAFGVKDENILRTGIPRTDLFYHEEYSELAKREIPNRIPGLNGRKIILYAPTYRDEDLNHFRLHLHLDEMYKELKDTHVVLLRLHQAIGSRATSYHRDFVYDFTDYPSMNELLFVSDYLITDYSSIPFEYSLLEKPMIFYPYDLKDYKEERGFWEDYETSVPGPIAYDTESIIKLIKQGQFDMEKIKRFSEEWNAYSKGSSSRNMVNYIAEQMKLRMRVRNIDEVNK